VIEINKLRSTRMLQRFASAAIVVALVAGVGLAAEIKGRAKNIDLEKKTITIVKEGEDKETKLTLADDAKFVGRKGNLPKEIIDVIVTKLNKSEKGFPVALTTDDESKKVTTVRFGRKKK
jgi:hypothetical protein